MVTGIGLIAMSLRLMDDLEADDPILSVVNLIDVFLVIIAALLPVIVMFVVLFMVPQKP